MMLLQILDDGWQHTTVNDHANGHQWGGRLTSFYVILLLYIILYII